MSAAWDAHYKRISDLIAANPVQRAPAAAVAPPVTVQPGVQAMLPAGLLDMWQGGGNGGQMGMPGGVDYGGAPGDLSALGGKLGGFGPMAGGLAGGLLGTALAGPFGGALAAWGGRSLAGLLGSSTPQPMAQDTVGPYGGVGIEVAPMGYGGGIAGEVGSPGFGGGTATDGSTGQGFGVDGEIGSWQSGGYTGAGRDGKVQPGRVAGLVHEGEYVIPAHTLRGLLSGQSATPFPMAPTRR